MEFPQAIELLLYGVLILFLVGAILSGFFQVQTAEAAVIQRMGKFNRVATAGINFKLPWLDQNRVVTTRSKSLRRTDVPHEQSRRD